MLNVRAKDLLVRRYVAGAQLIFLACGLESQSLWKHGEHRYILFEKCGNFSGCPRKCHIVRFYTMKMSDG